MLNKIIIVALILNLLLILIGLLYIVHKYTKNKYQSIIDSLQNELNFSKNKLINKSISLSFTECNDIIDTITDDLWKNKYYISYRLRDISIIPHMDEEITVFVREVIDSMSKNVMDECLKYYSYEYLIKKITRTGQMLFIEYTNNHKPNTK